MRSPLVTREPIAQGAGSGAIAQMKLKGPAVSVQETEVPDPAHGVAAGEAPPVQRQAGSHHAGRGVTKLSSIRSPAQDTWYAAAAGRRWR